MLYFLLTLVISVIISNNWAFVINDGNLNCTDKSPYCNKNDCITRPGYALEYCRKTCGDCQAFCQESQYVSCNITAKADCEFMLRDYCPIMCGICRPSKKKRQKTTLSTTTLPSLSTLDTRNSSTTVINKVLPSTTKAKPLPQNNSLTFLENPLNDNSILPASGVITPPLETRNNFLNVRRSDYHERQSRPRAYSVFNSGKPQQPNSSTEKVNIKAVPLITNFKNQIIIPPRIRKMQPQNSKVQYGYNSIQHRPQSYPFQFPYPQQLNHITTLYPPYPIDYGDANFFAGNEPPPPPIQPQPISLLNSQLYPQAPIVMYPMPSQPSMPTSNYIPPYNRNFVNQRRAQPTTASPNSPFFSDYDVIDAEGENAQEPFYTEEMPNPLPQPTTTTERPPKKSTLKSAVAIADLVTLLGCRDRDPIVCSKVTEESCRARPGFYLKLCPVKCKNCNGLACVDSNKIDCLDLQQRGGCRLPMAQEYCPKTCNTCPTPHFIAEQQSPCKDELETCEQLVESGVCEHPFSKPTMRLYCAKSCGFCKSSQYYVNDYFDIPKSFNIYPTTGTEF